MATPKKLTWQDAVRWLKAATEHLRRVGLHPTLTNYRIALTYLKSPFKSEDCLEDFGVSFEAVRHALQTGSRLPTPRKKTAAIAPRISHESGMEVITKPPGFEDEKDWAMMAKGAQRYKEQHEQSMSRSVRLPGKGPVGMILIGDAHIGGKGVDYDRLMKVADMANSNPNVFCLQIGDLIDSMIWNKVKVERWKTPLDIPGELRMGAHWLAKVVPKCVGIVGGNHDTVSYKMTGYAHIDAVLQMVGNKIPYNPHQLNLTLFVGEQPYVVVLRHKVPGKSQFRATHGAAKWFRWAPLDADMMIAGHIHVSGIQPVDLAGKRRWAVQLGAYKIVDEYADEHGFLHDCQTPDAFAIFHPDRKHIQCFEDIDEGLRHLGTYYQ
jgi:hypothetical protein